MTAELNYANGLHNWNTEHRTDNRENYPLIRN